MKNFQNSIFYQISRKTKQKTSSYFGAFFFFVLLFPPHQEHIPWSLVRPSWKSLRSSWRKLLRSSVCTVQEMVQRMIELRDNLTFTDQDAAFCLRPDSPWGRLALRCTREVLPNGGKDESHALYIEMNAEVRQWMSARSRASTFKSARVVKTAARAIGAMEKAITSQGLAALQSVPLEHILSCDPNWCVCFFCCLFFI